MLTLRASSLSADCVKRWAVQHRPPPDADDPMQYMRPRIEALVGPIADPPPHVGGYVGSGAHAGIRLLNEALRDTGEVGGAPRRRMAEDAAVAEIDRREDQAEPARDEVTPTRDTARRQAAGMSDQWHNQQRPDDGPVFIEGGLRGKIAGVEVTATPDLWSIRRSLVDAKSGKRPPAAHSYAPQQGVYSLELEAHGMPVDRIVLPWLPRAKKPRPMQMVEIDPAVAERAALNRIVQIRATVEMFDRALAGEEGAWLRDHPLDAIPERPESHLCSAKYCPAFGTAACNSWRLKP